MTGSSASVTRPFDELPDGTVKVPLGLGHGAVWPVVAQIAALSQRRAGCTASIGFLADRLAMHPSTIYDALASASGWIVTDTTTRVTRRFLAPLPEDAAWARISYRAAAGVGCRSVDGAWVARRNRSSLLELYCRLRRDEQVGRVRSQADLARDLDVSDRTVRALLATLEEDGWITSRPVGRMIAYRTHDAPLHLLNDIPRNDDRAGAFEPGPRRPDRTAEGSRKPTRNDLGSSGETISECDATQKQDQEAGSSKRDSRPLAAGELQRRTGEGRDALSRERRTRQDQINDEVRVSGAFSVMAAVPLGWQTRMSEAERERVLLAIEAEIAKGRTLHQMTSRIRRRLTWWAGREPRRAVAAALKVIQRGYSCPRPDCEDHLLPSGHPCEACTEIGRELNERRRAEPLRASATRESVLDRDPRPSTPGPRGVRSEPVIDAERAQRGAAAAREELRRRGLSTVDRLRKSGRCA